MKKSPQAKQVRETQTRKSETENKDIIKGAKSPLSGESYKPGTHTKPSNGPGPESEEYGRTWGRKGEKRAKKVLERCPFRPESSAKGPIPRKPVKRLRGTTPGKEAREKEKQDRRQGTSLLAWPGGARKGQEDNSTLAHRQAWIEGFLKFGYHQAICQTERKVCATNLPRDPSLVQKIQCETLS